MLKIISPYLCFTFTIFIYYLTFFDQNHTPKPPKKHFFALEGGGGGGGASPILGDICYAICHSLLTDTELIWHPNQINCDGSW